MLGAGDLLNDPMTEVFAVDKQKVVWMRKRGPLTVAPSSTYYWRRKPGGVTRPEERERVAPGGDLERESNRK